MSPAIGTLIVLTIALFPFWGSLVAIFVGERIESNHRRVNFRGTIFTWILIIVGLEIALIASSGNNPGKIVEDLRSFLYGGWLVAIPIVLISNIIAAWLDFSTADSGSFGFAGFSIMLTVLIIIVGALLLVVLGVALQVAAQLFTVPAH